MISLKDENDWDEFIRSSLDSINRMQFIERRIENTGTLALHLKITKNHLMKAHSEFQRVLLRENNLFDMS